MRAIRSGRLDLLRGAPSRRRGRAMAASLVVVLCSAGAADALRAQPAARGSIAGHVVDSAGHPVVGVDVRLSQGEDDRPVRVGRTRPDGRVAFDGLLPGGGYRLVVRSLGYHPDTARGIAVRGGDTTRVLVVLRAAAVELPTVTVRERRAARFSRPFIDSTEIANADVPPSYRRHAWDVVRFLRPVMLGDWNWKCAATEHVFVNGVRVTSRNITRPHEVLERIPADDIAEMRYVNCWDTSMPGVAGSNTVYVVLKPGRAYRW